MKSKEEILYNAIASAGGFKGVSYEKFQEMLSDRGDPDMYNGLKASFAAMEEYASQSAGQGSELFRWVKASERLPEDGYSFGEDEFGSFPIRWSFEHRIIVCMGYMEKGILHNANSMEPHSENVEWLEHIEPLPVSPTKPTSEGYKYYILSKINIHALGVLEESETHIRVQKLKAIEKVDDFSGSIITEIVADTSLTQTNNALVPKDDFSEAINNTEITKDYWVMFEYLTGRKRKAVSINTEN